MLMNKIVEIAKELKAISQIGLTYTKDPHDRIRFERLGEISHEMMATLAEVPLEKVRHFFVPDSGYATPKVDLRGAVFRDGHILLVREKSTGKWTLPGGWADVNESPREGIEREIREESGFTARARKLAAVVDRGQHDYQPQYPHHIYKLFFICELTGGTPTLNIEVDAIDFFPGNALPPLDTARVLPEDIGRAFRHLHDENLPTYFD